MNPSPEEQVMLRNGSTTLNNLFKSGTRFTIKQQVEDTIVIRQFCSCVNDPNKYVVTDVDANNKQILLIEEESGTCCRWFCNPIHPTRLVFKDPYTKQPVFYAKKPFRCFTCLNLAWPCAARVETVVDNEVVGVTTERPFTCCTPTMDVMSTDLGYYGTVDGPSGCLGGICSNNLDDYEFTNVNDNSIMTTISPKKFSLENPSTIYMQNTMGITNSFLNNDEMNLMFNREHLPSKGTAGVIAHTLSTVVLLDYMFYERTSNLQDGLFLGALYFNGCILPCYCGGMGGNNSNN